MARGWHGARNGDAWRDINLVSSLIKTFHVGFLDEVYIRQHRLFLAWDYACRLRRERCTRRIGRILRDL